MPGRPALLCVLLATACTPATLTPADLFFNDALMAARTEASPACPLSCVDENSDNKCSFDELTSTQMVAGTWTFSSCAVERASPTTTATSCSQTRFRIGQRENLVNWRDVAGPDGGTPVAIENGSSGFVIDSPMGFVSFAFPQLADGSRCLGITALTVSRSTGQACLLEVTTETASPTDGGCTPRAKWVLSQGTMSFTPGTF